MEVTSLWIHEFMTTTHTHTHTHTHLQVWKKEGEETADVRNPPRDTHYMQN